MLSSGTSGATYPYPGSSAGISRSHPPDRDSGRFGDRAAVILARLSGDVAGEIGSRQDPRPAQLAQRMPIDCLDEHVGQKRCIPNTRRSNDEGFNHISILGEPVLSR
jgi:hypothetical protein